MIMFLFARNTKVTSLCLLLFMINLFKEPIILAYFISLIKSDDFFTTFLAMIFSMVSILYTTLCIAAQEKKLSCDSIMILIYLVFQKCVHGVIAMDLIYFFYKISFRKAYKPHNHAQSYIQRYSALKILVSTITSLLIISLLLVMYWHFYVVVHIIKVRFPMKTHIDPPTKKVEFVWQCKCTNDTKPKSQLEWNDGYMRT